MPNIEHTENTDRVNESVCKAGESVLRETDQGRAGLVERQQKEMERIKGGGSTGVSGEFGKVEIFDPSHVQEYHPSERTEQHRPTVEPEPDANQMRPIPPPEPPVYQVLIPVEEQQRRKEQATIDKGKWMEENTPSMTKLGPPGEMSSEERAASDKQKKEAPPKLNALGKGY